MIRFIPFALLLLWSGFAMAEAAPFEQANERFKAGDFAGAAALYQKSIDADGPDASTLFNLGNCEQKLGHHGRAILAYERARMLAPRDPDLLANLALARKSAAVFEEPGRVPRIDAFFDYLSLNEWSWLVAGSALFLGALAVLRGISHRPLRGIRALAGTALLFIAVGSVALYLRRDERLRGVVIVGNATVRLSPFEQAESLGTAASGRMVRILKTEGGFHYVLVPGTGLKGWANDNEVSPVLYSCQCPSIRGF
jgi:tetratricopeptide (TPR) repeat protein